MSADAEKRPLAQRLDARQFLVAVFTRLSAAQTGWRETLMLLFWLVFLPFGVMVFLKVKLGFFGPVVNLDLLLVYLTVVVLSRLFQRSTPLLGTLGLVYVLGVHAFMGIGLIFVFDPLLLLDYFQFIEHWPWLMVGTGLAGCAVGFAAVYFGMRRLDFRRARLLPAVVLLLLLLGADIFIRTPMGYRLLGGNVATSSTATVLDLVRSTGAHQAFSYTMHPGASLRSDMAALPAPPPRILSIGIEAYGLSKDPDFNAFLAKALVDRVSPHYEVTQVIHASKGMTIAGEFRELCGVRIAVSPKRKDAEALNTNCLPKRLDALGYRTTGIHGNTGFFYMRDQLYPAIGFQHQLFHPQLRAEGGVECPSRSFPGICDRDSVKSALKQFGKAPKEFVHVMSLDTHYPFYSKSEGDRDCGSFGKVTNPELCMYGNQFASTLAEVGRTIGEAPVKPDVIYVFGDHPPPYLEANLRNFFKHDVVPVFILKRREAR